MGDYPIFRGWDVIGRARRGLKRSITNIGKSYEAKQVDALADEVNQKLLELGLEDRAGRVDFAADIAIHILKHLAPNIDDASSLPFFEPLTNCVFWLIESEELFAIPEALKDGAEPIRSEIWQVEDQLRRTAKILNTIDDAVDDLANLIGTAVSPLVEQHPSLIQPINNNSDDLSFDTSLVDNIAELPEIVEAMVQLPFAPELEKFDTTAKLKARLEYNLIAASGGAPGSQAKTVKLPTKNGPMPARQLIKTYLAGTPYSALFECTVPLTLPQTTRFEHHHIVAGSGHGKTQTLQHLILHDLEAVAAGKTSIVVIDSQSDLINNIAGMSIFAPGGPLADRLVLIDPTDVEWPVALNLFDVGMERINQYSQLDRERLINGILELYDFVLGSLLDAGMTQKQSVIFRYITRLLLHIPNATIHTFRELLEDDGFDKHYEHIKKLEGSARSFFESEFRSKEFTGTKKQVLRRLYGILENQTFERMFSHPKSKLDLFTEMNADKVILINTAKDLLKENGTEIFGRFFIAMIAQAAQERAVLDKNNRLPTFVYVDEANDYFDRNIGIILSQARKYNIGMVLAHQFLGQLDNKLLEAISANTSIKFAGGVSAKDARAMAAELRTDPGFVEGQDRLSFAAFVKGSTKQAVSLSITPGEMESQDRLSDAERDMQRDAMRKQYAVHYTEINKRQEKEETADDVDPDTAPKPDDDSEIDDGEPDRWE
jgi:hypothetical protein